ncbi:MAG: hypothetical protein JNM52_10970 [Betaproteobacteria bacterium]|nr:hypothetical protein [Betaproteobacteria bacterium]
MSWPVAGSGAWLLQNELRLIWRSVSIKRKWLGFGLIGLFWAIFHFALWKALQGKPDLAEGAGPMLTMVSLGYWLLFTIMLSQVISQSVTVLFERGDLDLLFASPLSSRSILTARSLSLAVSAIVLPAFFALPIAHAGALTGHVGWLAIYPTLAVTALFETAIGILITLGLVALFGAKAAKTIAQLLGALAGAIFFLWSQLHGVLSKQNRQSLSQWLEQNTTHEGWLGVESPLWWPARAMSGEWIPLLALAAIGVGLFHGSIALTHRRFARGAQEVQTGGKTRTRPAEGGKRFSRHFTWLLLVKEWKLLWRDPYLISHTALQSLYMAPMLVVAYRLPDKFTLVIPAIVLLGAGLVGNLAWLTITAEDAPELIGSSPLPIERIRWIKAAAACIPVWAVILPVALYWMQSNPFAALLLVGCLAGSTICAALMQIWNPRVGKRNDLKRRYQENRLINFLEGFTSIGWAGIAVCLQYSAIWLPIPAGLVLICMGLSWGLGYSARQQGALAA